MRSSLQMLFFGSFDIFAFLCKAYTGLDYSSAEDDEFPAPRASSTMVIFHKTLVNSNVDLLCQRLVVEVKGRAEGGGCQQEEVQQEQQHQRAVAGVQVMGAGGRLVASRRTGEGEEGAGALGNI